MGLLAYPFIEAIWLRTDEHTVKIASLPQNLKGLRILYVTDIHYGSLYPQSRVEQLFATINDLSPDLVLFGGDYADDTAGAIEFFEHLPLLNARLGAYGVFGNHDRTDESQLNTLTGVMNSAKVTPLNNAVATVKVGQSYLYIAGVDDFDNGFPDVKGVAAQVSEGDTVVFLGHSPDLLTAAFSARGSDGNSHWFDLALFGHTHGGQITLFGNPIIDKFSPEIGTRYLTGWREENRASILVSNGVGTSYVPMRLFAFPQIHLITIKSK